MSLFKKILGGGSSDEPSNPAEPSQQPTAQAQLPIMSEEFAGAIQQHQQFATQQPTLEDNLAGIDWSEAEQKRIVSEVLPKWRPEVSELLEKPHLTEIEGQPVVLDHAILYSMICELEPSRLIEVGCGRTTHTIRAAFTKHNMPCELIAIDPKPVIDIAEVTDAHMDQPVQEIPIDDFLMLQPNEFLVIDLSHIHLTGSDVADIYGRILPKLNKGVVVAIHGVAFPKPPSPNALKAGHNEDLLLKLFLNGNKNIELIYNGGYAVTKLSEDLDQYWEVDASDLVSQVTWFRIG